MDFLNILIDASAIPALTAFLLGVLTSISPCPLATNIAAVAYLSRNLKTARAILAGGVYYAAGRAASYIALAVLIYFGLSSFSVSGFVQIWGYKILGPALILIGLGMMFAGKIKFSLAGDKFEKIKLRLARQGALGAFLLGAMFAMAFCPYSAVIFFGALIPLIMAAPGGLLLPPFFALGTALPAVAFSFLIAFGAKKIGAAFGAAKRAEKIVRAGAAIAFIAVGVYCILKTLPWA